MVTVRPILSDRVEAGSVVIGRFFTVISTIDILYRNELFKGTFHIFKRLRTGFNLDLLGVLHKVLL